MIERLLPMPTTRYTTIWSIGRSTNKNIRGLVHKVNLQEMKNSWSHLTHLTLCEKTKCKPYVEKCGAIVIGVGRATTVLFNVLQVDRQPRIDINRSMTSFNQYFRCRSGLYRSTPEIGFFASMIVEWINRIGIQENERVPMRIRIRIHVKILIKHSLQGFP